MDPGLLSCPDTDGLSILYIADRVGLCIFQRDHGNGQVNLGCIWQILILRHDIIKEILADMQFVSALFKVDAIYLLAFQRGR